MQGREYIELGRLQIDFPIEYRTILDLSIEETANEHGRMSLTLMVTESMSQSEVRRLEGVNISVSGPEGELLFVGICQAVGLQMEAGYHELVVQAVSQSIKTDIKKNNRTFQNPAKVLSDVANAVMATYGIRVELTEDIPVPKMLHQKNETDWAFCATRY